MLTFRQIITSFSLISLCMSSQSQYSAHRASSEVLFDGIPDEAAWDGATPFPFITQVPTYGIEPGQRSVVKLLFDDQNIYIGGSLFVDEPGLISAIGKKRDQNIMSTDWFGIIIDTYNDKENAMAFFTNPNELRWDAALSNDGTPGDVEPMNVNWNNFWDVKTVVTDSAWHTELQIPISSLRFESSGDEVIMGLSLYRHVAALNEGYIFPDIPYNWGGYSNLKVSRYAEISFKGLEPRRPIYISPYLLAGIDQFNELNDAENAYEFRRDPVIEPGLDLKYGITPNTTLDLTVNTDFAQVEADDQQFNLTRFSLVFPEKRLFFQERASIFEFSLGGPNQLFYSRRIGLNEGEPIRILGGGRLVSKVNGWDIGVLDLQTGVSDALPGENFGVFRARKRLFNENSYMGGMITSRVGVNGTFNLAYGLDGVIRVVGDEYLTVRWAQTIDENPANRTDFLEHARFMINWTRRKERGFGYDLHYNRSGTAFDPGIGLEVFEDYYLARPTLKYTWVPGENSALQYHSVSALNMVIASVIDGAVLTNLTSVNWTLYSKSGWMATIAGNYNYENLQEDFELPDSVSIPAGSYPFFNTSITGNTPATRKLWTTFTIETGQYYDGVSFSSTFEPTASIGAGLDLGGIYRYDFVDFADRNQRLSNHILGVRGLYMFSTKLSLSAFVQYNTAIQKVISNVRFRYNPKEGTDLYIVFNEGRNTSLHREMPVLPVYDLRSLMLKFTYTFNL